MIRAVDHINIVVTDLARSVRFYTEVLGFMRTKDAYLEGEWIEKIVGLRGVKANVTYVVAPAGEPRLQLLCYDVPKGANFPPNSQANTVGLRHIALRVDDIEAAVGKLRACGMTVFA